MPDQQQEKDYEASPVRAGLRRRCPRCGKGHLFRAYLKVADECEVCGLDFRSAENADGPAVLITMIVGFPVTFAMAFVEIAYEPPIWLHLVIWIPLIIILSLLALPPLKGIFVAQQLYHEAADAQFDLSQGGDEAKASDDELEGGSGS